MTVIYDRQYELLLWAVKQIGIEKFRPDAQAIGHERNGKIVAVAVFDGFSDVDCNVHLASDGSARWNSREFIVRCMAYPFIQMNLRRLTGLVPAGNERALRFNQHFGFKIEGVHREANCDGGDIISMGLLRRECRWIPAEYRK